MPDPVVTKINALTLDDLQPLLEESRAQGFEFLDRLWLEYCNHTNRFAHANEALFGVYQGPRMIAIGGLNRDPYLTRQLTGRVRHVYVLSAWRRQGIGSLLMRHIINTARQHYPVLTLRTLSATADAFYRSLGFQTKPAIESASHHLILPPERGDTRP